MGDLEYDRFCIIGDAPHNLHPRFRYEQDGSIAKQLNAQGFYQGIAAAKVAIEECFADQPEVLAQVRDIFIIETEASRDQVTTFPALVRPGEPRE